ncbi:MAG TPA: SDR family oxidoreductase [Myxococcota bacterium]|nr:SDR family oxidoreductase [Myxococcota bacterium]
MLELEGRVALVTGAARGVGAAIAQRFVEAGAFVVIGDVLEDAGRETAETLGAAARFHALDVTSEEAWSHLVEETLAVHERIDVLVHNAAVLHLGTIENTPPEVFERLMRVNTLGPFLGTRAVLPAMKARQRGSIVHVGSIDGLVAMNGISAYAASKWGMRGLAKASALELGRDGIRVNSVCPAGGNTMMYGPWLEKMVSFLEETASYTRNRGIPGAVPIEAIAESVLYLASDSSAHVTGIDLPVDGGASAGRFIPGFNTL